MRSIPVCVVLGAVLVLLGNWGPACAAIADTSWGVVDMGRVEEEYRGMQDLNQQFQEFQREQEREFETRRITRALYEEERQEFLDLLQMGAPTDEREARLAELEALSDQRERRLVELDQMPARSPEQEQDYQAIKELYDKRVAELAALQASIREARVAKYEELSKVIADSITGAVKAVAEEKKLPLVLRKDVVLYGGSDITDEVLAKLNAGAPTAPAG